MRALQHYLLAPLAVATAIFALLALGASAQFTAAPATHTRTVVADPICPAGTNWDNVLNECR